MLKQNIKQHINELVQSQPSKIELNKEEKSYAERHGLLPSDMEAVPIESNRIFQDAYLERCEKETVSLIIVETPRFLNEKITHLKSHKDEFLYVESKSFDRIGVDAISLEIDDVFGTYTALFGLKMKKQFEAAIKNYLETNLENKRGRFSVAFSGQDDYWNMNIAVNYIDGFKEEMTLLEACELVYSFIFHMVETIEENK